MHRFLLITSLALAALMTVPAAGRAADGDELGRFADAIASSWVPHQGADGIFVDPILGRGSGYGTVMIGYGLLRAGVRRRDPKLIEAGIRAFDAHARMNTTVRSYFALLPFAKGYTFAKDELRDNPLWQRSRAGWESYLRSFSRGPLENLAGPCIVSST